MTYDPSTIAPYSQDAEEALLGAVLINPAMYVIVSAFLRAEDFFILRHQYIWEAMGRLSERNEIIDLLTVREELRQQNRLNDIGGPGYLAQLTLNVPTSVHAEVYGHLVERAGVRRRLLSASDEIRGLAMDEELPLDQVIADTERKIFDVTALKTQKFETSAAVASRKFDQLADRMANPDETDGLPTGFRDLDQLLSGGIRRGELVLLGARPGMGKSAMAGCITRSGAALGARVLYVNREMTNDQLMARLLAIETGVSTTKMKTGMTQAEYARCVQGLGRLGNLPVFMDDRASMTLMQLKQLCQIVQHAYGLDLVIIDHLGLLKASSKPPQNRTQEVTEITYFLKHEIARDLNVPVLAQSQLSRALETRQDKRPQLSDLRDSGSSEQDADIVLFLYRDEAYNEATEFPNTGEVILAKNRDGATGTVTLHYEKSLTRWTDSRTQVVDLSML